MEPEPTAPQKRWMAADQTNCMLDSAQAPRTALASPNLALLFLVVVPAVWSEKPLRFVPRPPQRRQKSRSQDLDEVLPPPFDKLGHVLAAEPGGDGGPVLIVDVPGWSDHQGGAHDGLGDPQVDQHRQHLGLLGKRPLMSDSPRLRGPGQNILLEPLPPLHRDSRPKPHQGHSRLLSPGLLLGGPKFRRGQRGLVALSQLQFPLPVGCIGSLVAGHAEEDHVVGAVGLECLGEMPAVDHGYHMESQVLLQCPAHHALVPLLLNEKLVGF
mmetsp:Transcript_13725/g.30402  ORF Transcript_13725/g.30402 Transcript_13725/m.30402 type:complete len:269 (-) Transcript_13725:48-854(-)